MGMRQRLAIAAALLGDPEVLILDEPTNGLDPPGIRWVRDLVRHQAGIGRAVLISSHLLSEVAQSVDDIVVIADGTLRAQGPLDQVLGGGQQVTTFVRSANPARLAEGLVQQGRSVEPEGHDGMVVRATPPGDVGLVAAQLGVPLIELRPLTRSLEDAFLALTEAHP
jgi:ABC-2 type transport system ATP-binding protein